MDTTQPVAVQAHYTAVKKLGHWTTARRFEVRARRGMAVLDLRSPRIEQGEIEVRLDLDHSMVKLLLPEDAVVDHWDLHWLGRGRVKDHEAPRAEGGRRVRLVGEIRHGEVRVRRGGIAMLSAMFSRAYVEDLRRAHREGGMPTVDDPTRVA
ncbi:hypothetical protein GCM10010174_81890 [Kutzneria viridogrisea]|uniref:Uncharacterized protein n=2 Tax=Kutzneria TaxID=43356 RepID=W5WHJ2_9PSEU|nr:hypothetical protein [Kutzneria albida]AHI00077.1 hypothetical protein KALB_6718 [Kutzneria albida DSM 43870]MBA8925256.1 hypothetical protein [Kutzneria viridogrisea]